MLNYYTPLAVLTGFVLIAVVIWFRRGNRSDIDLKDLQTDVNDLNIEKSRLETNLELTNKTLSNTEVELKLEREQNSDLKIKLAEIRNDHKNLEEKLISEKMELEKIQKKFTEAFENLANKIFEEKSTKFTKENRTKLDEILLPLKDKIKDFEQKVELSSEKTRLSHNSLIAQINNLKELNKKISDDAENLTKALKGDVKIQGNWGEVILERILEESGLTKGIEYESQAKGMGLKSEEGTSNRPDVIIKLPEEKHIIVDSKVSLIDYERMTSTEDNNEQMHHLKAMNSSIKKHIDGLDKKHYHLLKGLNSPDFVLLFIPIEGVFTVLMQQDSNIYKYALDRQIVIVSPSTLLATLRTIAFIWRQENQTKNSLEIARQSGNLYDSFVRFLSDLEKIGTNINRANDAYIDAVKKLSTGRGNLVTRVENLKKLGAKASKEIPDKYQSDLQLTQDDADNLLTD
jgi:DNA recombination protein RmuC